MSGAVIVTICPAYDGSVSTSWYPVMMRSVLNEGTGAGARAAGFTLDAAGKSGTTNDLRDAWFVGFTTHLLTVVWVGFDDNQPVSLSGSQAALPIWTQFMAVAFVRIADSRCELPVLYSITAPGAANIGRASECCTQLRDLTHAP